jgi:hypothetical protein
MITAKDIAELTYHNIKSVKKDRIKNVQKEMKEFDQWIRDLLSCKPPYIRYQAAYDPIHFNVYYQDKFRELTLETILFTEELKKMGFRTTCDFETQCINVFWRPKDVI